jgi:D-alanyl-lipoteichoic acid acyltransferase DltB (MBOAT superfamily)
VLFNSFEFLLFLPIVFILYWFIINKKLYWQNLLLLTASYFFYGWWSWKFMGLLMLSTFLDYAYGFWVASPNGKKAKLFLWLSIINNLGILGVFKYYNFFAIQLQNLIELLGLKTNPLLLQVALPIGISFYTFHGMSYVFDIYRGHKKPVRNIVEYAVFVSFFPLLVAGPIERSSHLLPQIQKPRFFNYTQAVEGCRLILWGMFKKVVIADSLAGIVDNIFSNYQDQNGITLIIGAVAFSFQIYGDFSGYSDIALGTAKLFGFELLSNFKFPYFSRDVAEFWRRWHISLSSWFRDYLYIPLGGSKNGKYNAVRNTFIIFLISGFWHGASWNFIAWGFIHACGFLPLLLRNRNRKHVTDVVAQDRKLPNIKELWQMFTTFTFVSFAWIFFRADGIHFALGYIKQIGLSIIESPRNSLLLASGEMAFIYIFPLIVGDWYLRRDERRYQFNRLAGICLSFLSILWLIKSFGNNTSFIYFQF